MSDKPGYCCNCGKKVIEDRLVGGEWVPHFTPDYDEYMFDLTDGSKMRVCMCKQCVARIDDVDTVEVMGKVVAGWENSTVKFDKKYEVKIKPKKKKKKEKK